VPAREVVLQRLQQPVADHALRHGPEGVERVGLAQLGVVGGLEGEDAHLRSVAVGDDDLVVLGERRERLHGAVDVVALGLGVGLLSPLEQGISAEGDDDSHVPTPPGWRP